MTRFRPVDSETIQTQLRLLEPAIRDRVRDVANSASAIDGLGYLVFEVSPEAAFKHFPVTIATFDAVCHWCDTAIANTQLLDNRRFLDPKYDYPLGRFDWIGTNTIPDYELVFDEIAGFIYRLWQDLDLVPLVPVAFIGCRLYDEFDVDSPCDVLNLATGSTQQIVFKFDD